MKYLMIATVTNTSLAVPGALAHRMQRRTACIIQYGNKVVKIRQVINLITIMQSMSSKSLSLIVVVVKSMMVVVKENDSHPIRSR